MTRLVIVLGNQELTPELEAWSLGFSRVQRRTGFDRETSVFDRNEAILDFLLSKDEWLVMADHDAVPDNRTAALLETGEKLASVRCVKKNGKESHPSTFTAHLFRVHREVLDNMEPPWFGRDARTCPCRWFYERALKAGYRAAKIGAAGHAVSGQILWPKERN